jgi:alginate O-acetyltransferase complex protein AlgJ
VRALVKKLVMRGPLAERRARASAARDVIRGKDGWLFLRGGSNDVLDQHTGRRAMTAAARDAWHAAVTERSAWAADQGIAYRAIFVPDSQAVYRDKLPDDIAAQLIAHDQRPVPAMIASMPPRVRAAVLYPLDELIAVSGRDKTFQRGDTHWTEFGSWTVYRTLKDSLADLQVDWISDDRVRFHVREEWGDLGSKLDPPQTTKCVRADVADADATRTYTNNVHNNGFLRAYRRAGPAAACRCLVFADSAARNIERFLVNTFEETILVHSSRRFDYRFAEAIAPDLVITLGVERFAIEPPQDHTGDALAAVIAAKQAAGAVSGPPEGSWDWPHALEAV